MNNNSQASDNYATNDQLKQLKQDIITPDNFAKIFSESIGKSKVLEKSIKDCLKSLITDDTEIKGSINKRIYEHDKEKRKEFNSKL